MHQMSSPTITCEKCYGLRVSALDSESSLGSCPVLAKTVAPKIVSRAKFVTISTACFLYALPRGFVIPIRKSVGLLRNVKFNIPSGINTGMLCCIVKLPDEVCVSHTKRVGENKTVLQLK